MTTLVIIWGITVILSYTWGGFLKFIRAILFPGFLIRYLIKLNVVKEKVDKYSFLFSLNYSTMLIRVNIKSPWDLIKFVYLPTPILLSLSIIFITLAFLANTLGVVFIWLAVSMFVASLPESKDFELMFFYITLKFGRTTLYLLWSIVVFTVSYFLLGLDTAVVITSIYFISIITFLVILYWTPKDTTSHTEEDYLVDKSTIVIG